MGFTLASRTLYHGIEIDRTLDDTLSPFALDLLRTYYMRKDEQSPQEAFARAAVAYAEGDKDFAQRIYDYASKGWFMFASPVLSNAPIPNEPWKAHVFWLTSQIPWMGLSLTPQN